MAEREEVGVVDRDRCGVNQLWHVVVVEVAVVQVWVTSLVVFLVEACVADADLVLCRGVRVWRAAEDPDREHTGVVTFREPVFGRVASACLGQVEMALAKIEGCVPCCPGQDLRVQIVDALLCERRQRPGERVEDNPPRLNRPQVETARLDRASSSLRMQRSLRASGAVSCGAR